MHEVAVEAEENLLAWRGGTVVAWMDRRATETCSFPFQAAVTQAIGSCWAGKLAALAGHAIFVDLAIL